MSESPLREWVRAVPFIAFLVTLSSGRHVTVTGPEMIILGKRRDVVSFVDEDGYDRLVVIYHDHIVSVDSYDAVQTPAPPDDAAA